MSLLWNDNEWTFPLIDKVYKEIEQIGVGEMGLDIFPNQIEVISSDQMLDAYASHAMPVMYKHWSFGKSYSVNKKLYENGQQGLAYEVVINSNPCIAYLMEDNTMTMQALVMAHASIGHNNFFKTNYLFQQWTDPDGIIDYLIFAKNYVAKCEERYGAERVEEVLDSCHALMDQGMDRFKRARKRSRQEEKLRAAEREAYHQSRVSELWPDTWKSETPAQKEERKKRILPEPEDNILYFIEKNSPILEPWEREIVRIVRKVSQYFWPQMQTQVGNEGWATHTHYFIMNRLYEKGLISDGSLLEFFKSHTGVIAQYRMQRLNPYCLGFNIFRDIKRMCEKPTDEDREWFPDLVGMNWLEAAKDARENYKDESLILQYLSPKVIRDLKLFSILDDYGTDSMNYIVQNIHDREGYKEVRRSLSRNYDINMRIPQIQVSDVNVDGDRKLILRHTRHNYVPLDQADLKETLLHVRRLWGFAVRLDFYNPGAVSPTDWVAVGE